MGDSLTFERVISQMVISLIVVGMPAIVLKQTAIWFLRVARDRPRLVLLGSSVGGCAGAGLVAILGHAVLVAYQDRIHLPPFSSTAIVELPTAVLLLVLVGGPEAMLWQRFVRSAGMQSLRATAIWLIGGNAWIPWALFLMHAWGATNGFID